MEDLELKERWLDDEDDEEQYLINTDDAADPKKELMTINMGPQHPSTHGVLRLIVTLNGEEVVKCESDIGYLHTGIEKQAETKTYNQALTLTDRTDYLNPLINNLGFSLAVEKLLGIVDRVPPKAQVARVLLTELQRISSHLVWLGTHAMDLGAQSTFLYGMRDREKILDIFEMCQWRADDDELHHARRPVRRLAARLRCQGSRIHQVFQEGLAGISRPVDQERTVVRTHQRRRQNDRRGSP